MKTLFPFLTLLLAFSCHKPNLLDHEVATGKILKKVICNDNSNTDYWLVQFVPTRISIPKYGISVNLDSKVYENVVSTDFNFQSETVDTSKIYVLNFDLKNDVNRKCEVSLDQSISIPSIDIRSIVPTDAQ